MVRPSCPFDRAIQRPKDGGAETSLGRWGSWLESPADASGEAGVKKYHRMKYSGGATCWNGPARSVDVTLHCGLENRLSSASEPSRCEYSLHFITPALCVREESLMTPAAEADASADHATSHEELCTHTHIISSGFLVQIKGRLLVYSGSR